MREHVFTDKPISACYGCQSCAQICPHRAITMRHNDEGFVYPHIDTEKCVDCGLCERACPTQEANIAPLYHTTPKMVYAAWNRNNAELMESTSGGIFYLLARQFLKDGGVVYGVVYGDGLVARHSRISDIETLKQTRGSKYMQSDIGLTFRQIRDDLKNGLRVLFSGTPCQIAGLRLFLRKPFANLVTIDLVCHGVPSPMLFKLHIKHLETIYSEQITDFKFRAKKLSGWRTYTKYIFKQRKSIYSLLGEDYYSHAFHIGYFSRMSCYTCAFAQSKRVGDITLSDFWNAEKCHPELKKARKYGFNLVMCNTEAGRQLLNAIKEQVECHQYPVESAIQGDIRLRNTEPQPEMRDKAYKLVQEKGYAYMVTNYGLKQTMFQRLTPMWVINLIREIQCRLK